MAIFNTLHKVLTITENLFFITKLQSKKLGIRLEWQHPCGFLWEALAFSGGEMVTQKRGVSLWATSLASVLQRCGCPFLSATCPLQSPRGQGLCGRGSIPSGRLVPGGLGWATRRPRRTELSAPSPACDHQPPPHRPVWGQLKLGASFCSASWGGVHV